MWSTRFHLGSLLIEGGRKRSRRGNRRHDHLLKGCERIRYSSSIIYVDSFEASRFTRKRAHSRLNSPVYFHAWSSVTYSRSSLARRKVQDNIFYHNHQNGCTYSTLPFIAYHSETPSTPTSIDLLRYDTRPISYVWGVKVHDSSIDSAAFSRVIHSTWNTATYSMASVKSPGNIGGVGYLIVPDAPNANLLHSGPLSLRAGSNITYAGCFKRMKYRASHKYAQKKKTMR